MRVSVRPSRRWLADHGPWTLVIGSILGSFVLALFLAVPTAHADSPFNDIRQLPPQGGGGGGADVAPDPAAAEVTRDLVVPPPMLVTTVPNAAPLGGALAQQNPATNPNNPLAWIGLGLNPGKWLLDSVLGATTGILYSLAAVFEVLGRFGNGQIVDLNGDITTTSDAAFGFLFTTPESLTIAWAGASGLGSPGALHDVVRQVALSILVIVCTYRAVFVLISGQYRDGLIDLFVSFLGGLLGIQGAWYFCTLFVRASNVITEAALQQAFGAGLANWIPLDPATYFWSSTTPMLGASLTVALVTLVYWAILALLALHAIARIVMVNLLLMALCADAKRYRQPAGRAGLGDRRRLELRAVWFFRLVELLATPLIWGLTLGFGRALMSGFGVDTQPILGPILAVFAMLMVFKAPKLLGLAAQEAVTGARTMLRISERTVYDSLRGSPAGGAGGDASATTTSSNAPPTVYVDM
ncbi:hypothetical protein HC891_14870, partial [Candidatus Gracilibacteria bacterium]|nr:hypothetical protein [Candidatus Gracilibacteria bacterium]